MSNTARHLQVFLSYAQEDYESVHEVYERLKNEDWIEPWQDKPQIELGETWTVAIKRAISSADAVVIFLSENSIHKEGFVHSEMRYAWQLSLQKPPDVIFLIPIRLDNCEVPEYFYELDSKQWGDYFGAKKDETYTRLLRALKLRLEQKEKERIRKGAIERQLVEEKEGQARKEAKEKARLAAEEKAHKEKEERERLSTQKAEADQIVVAKQSEPETAPRSKSSTYPPSKTGTAVPRTKHLTPPAIGGVVIASLLCLGFGLYFLYNNLSAASIFRPLPTYTPPSNPVVGSIWVSRKDGMAMMYVPAGKFTMGSNNGDSNEQPVHTVYLDAFWIDQTEISNAMYAKCVSGGACKGPTDTTSPTRSSYYGNAQFDDYPVIYVDWYMAKAYCEWRGDVLPTEAEWEKAARGIDGRVYPWGNNFDCAKGNFDENSSGSKSCDGYPDTAPVGSFISGASPYGLYNMAGNVWEWVSDWYSDTYYQNSPSSNPLGPDTGQYRVLRGGSWFYYSYDARTSSRFMNPPAKPDYLWGFRCARLAK